MQIWSEHELAYESTDWNMFLIKLYTHSRNFYNAHALKMSTTKELGGAWFGCQAEIKHLKAVLKLKGTHILTLKEYIRTLKRKEVKKRQREQNRSGEKKEVKKPEKTLIYDQSVGDLNNLCATCQLYYTLYTAQWCNGNTSDTTSEDFRFDPWLSR